MQLSWDSFIEFRDNKVYVLAPPSQQAEFNDNGTQWLDDKEELQGRMLEARPRQDTAVDETLTLG